MVEVEKEVKAPTQEEVDKEVQFNRSLDKPVDTLTGTVTADEIANREDKTFKITGYGMRKLRSLDDESKEVEKLVLYVELSDGVSLDYFPNKTSQDTIRNKLGTRLLKEWVGKTFEWEVLKQNVAGNKRNVLFIKE